MISLFLFSNFFIFNLKEFFYISMNFKFDIMSMFIISIFSLVWFLVMMVFFNFITNKYFFLYKMIFFFFFFFLFMCFSTSNSFYFLFFLESCVFVMIFFILNFSKDLDKISSVFFMVLINFLGSLPFIFFCKFNLEIYNFSLNLNMFFNFFILFCFFLMLSSKLPIFLLHFWLTKAHVSASGSGSMILASLMLKIGSLGMVKWCYLFFSLFKFFFIFFLVFMMISMIFIIILMNRFFDLKFLVACSSIVHMILMFPFLFFNSFSSFFSSCLMMVSHGITSLMLFFFLSVIYEISYNRSLSSNKSMESFSFSLMMIFFFWFFMNLGFPPFLSFISELIFMNFFLFLDSIFLLLFMIIFILSGKFFITMILNFLFSKTFKFNLNFFSNFIFSFSNLMSFYFFFLIFYF